MPITLLTAAAVDHNAIQLGFSEAFVQNRQLFSSTSYAFSVRYGERVDILADSIEVVSSSSVRIILNDAMLKGGHYRITVHNIFGSDGIPIQEQAPLNVVDFNSGSYGDSITCFRIRKHIPKDVLDTRYGTDPHAIVCGIGEVIDRFSGTTETTAYSKAAAALVIRSATGEDLSVIGQNYGVIRPSLLINDDTTYREVLPYLIAAPRATLGTITSVLEAILGPKSDGWEVYAVNPNEFVIEVDAAIGVGLGEGTLASATYFHADASEHSPPSYPGDYFLADATVDGTTVGGNVVLIYRGISFSAILDDLRAATVQMTVEIVG